MKKFIAVAVFLSLFSAAHARQGYVLRVEGPRVHVDYGTASGINEGDTVRVFRVDITEHPATGRQIESRVLIEPSARVLSAGRNTSVILLPDAQIREGMRIFIERGARRIAGVSGISGLRLYADYVSFSSEDTIVTGEAGYRYTSADYGVEIGGGGIESASERYYFGYAEPAAVLGDITLSARLMVGAVADGIKLGYGGGLRAGGQTGPVVEARYRYYPELGSSADLEIGAGLPGKLSPVMKLAWTGIPKNDGAISISGGAEIKLGGGSSIKPMAGVAARDADRLGFTAGLSALFAF